MYLEKFEPIKELTLDVIEGLQIHITHGSLKTYAAMKELRKVDGTDSVPTLYYVYEYLGTLKRSVWTVHALSCDVTRYLLVHSIKDTDNG